MDENELNLINRLKVNELYVHLFDVDKKSEDADIEPFANTSFKGTWPKGLDIIPVIYITQRTFIHISDSELGKLASNIIDLSRNMTSEIEAKWSEFQIDCDWTAGSKNQYFKFLKLLKQKINLSIPLSCTIRLHQIKYPEKTGIPPVDKGMLMFYNMGDLKIFSEKNSIYDYDVSSRYLDRLQQYPLLLDYALPSYSWGLKYRFEELQEIIPENRMTDIELCNHLKKLGDKYVCISDGFCSGSYFQKGDLIKVEKVSAELCKIAAKQVSKYVNSSKFKVVFYHLGSDQLKKYEANKIKDIISVFN
ncbi:MAG: hypothetical protein WED33_06205 [Bacteroidia bacterium]